MKISNETIQVLKNFASINSNLMIRKGKTLSTISTAKNIFAKAEVKEDFPQEVAIYDLNSLLALLTMMENQEIEFGENSLTISKGAGKFEYFYAAANVIVAAPEKNIELDNHYQFKLTAEDVNTFMKAAAVTGAPAIYLSAKNGKVVLSVGDIKNDTANSYRKTIGDSDLEFQCVMAVENFKIVPDDYTVTVSKKKAFLIKNDTKPIEYFIAMEPVSTI